MSEIISFEGAGNIVQPAAYNNIYDSRQYRSAHQPVPPVSVFWNISNEVPVKDVGMAAGYMVDWQQGGWVDNVSYQEPGFGRNSSPDWWDPNRVFNVASGLPEVRKQGVYFIEFWPPRSGEVDGYPEGQAQAGYENSIEYTFHFGPPTDPSLAAATFAWKDRWYPLYRAFFGGAYSGANNQGHKRERYWFFGYANAMDLAYVNIIPHEDIWYGRSGFSPDLGFPEDMNPLLGVLDTPCLAIGYMGNVTS